MDAPLSCLSSLLALQTTLIHLGAKYAPCMRWDETLSREIKESRLKERDTACCIRKDRSEEFWFGPSML